MTCTKNIQCHCPHSLKCSLYISLEHVLNVYGGSLVGGGRPLVRLHLRNTGGDVYHFPSLYPSSFLAPLSCSLAFSFSIFLRSLSSFRRCFISDASFSFLSFSLTIATYPFDVSIRTPVIRREGRLSLSSAGEL